MTDLVLLLFLLTPPEPSVTFPEPPESLAGWQTLKRFALVHELVGPHERWSRWEDEVPYVRRYYHLLQDAPPLCDCFRVPDAASVDRGLDFLRAYSSRLSERRLAASSWQEPWFADAEAEADRLIEIYSAIAAVHNCESWVSKRRALLRLRQALGDHDYLMGNWPPPAPAHRFQLINH